MHHPLTPQYMTTHDQVEYYTVTHAGHTQATQQRLPNGRVLSSPGQTELARCSIARGTAAPYLTPSRAVKLAVTGRFGVHVAQTGAPGAPALQFFTAPSRSEAYAVAAAHIAGRLMPHLEGHNCPCAGGMSLACPPQPPLSGLMLSTITIPGYLK